MHTRHEAEIAASCSLALVTAAYAHAAKVCRQCALRAHQGADVDAPIEPVEEGCLLPAVARVVLVELVRAESGHAGLYPAYTSMDVSVSN